MTNKKSTLSIALGSVFVASMAVSATANAVQNPFTMASLESGYMVAAADKAKEGKCGEGKCGANKAASDSKMKEGKCGEGKCGANKASGEKMKEEDKSSAKK